MSNIENDENANLIDDAEEATIGMTEIDGFDFERALMLMHIMEKVATVAPKATSVLGCAQAALNEMNEDAKAIAQRRADEFAKAEAKARVKAESERKAREAEEAEAAEQGKAADDEVRLQPRQPLARAIPSRPPTTETARRV